MNWELIFSFLPIVILIFLMTRKNSMPSYKALPLVALITYLIIIFVFEGELNLVHATIISGFLLAWTPILIIAGAVFLFRTMEATGALELIRRWLNQVTENKVAQLMIVGWAFMFLIEGASGFGTPAALAAPILVGLGFPAVRVAIVALIMNTVSVTFGAVGTPTWFGFSAIGLLPEEIMEVTIKSAIVNAFAALIIPLIALLFIIKKKSIGQNLIFIYLSILVTIIPYLIIAFYNYEFPSLIGGFIGLVLTVVLAKLGIGLSGREVVLREAVSESGLPKKSAEEPQKLNSGALLKASFPLWGTILVLVITRIPQLGLRSLLTSPDPSVAIDLGYLGELNISSTLVLTLENILRTDVDWVHSLLYVPSIIPFVLISIVTFAWFKTSWRISRSVIHDTAHQMFKPTLALIGALVFVTLMMMGGENSPVTVIGSSLADYLGNVWPFVASFLGALGAFFSGSATISNLTFGGIQNSIAISAGFDKTTILALQSVGAAMGNMISINNIVAVASVLALGNVEGYILKKTIWALLVYGMVAAMAAFFL
jgi:lactate permease